MRFSLPTVLLISGCVVALPSAAQDNPFEQCEKAAEPAKRIAACTQIIASGKLNPTGLQLAHLYRSIGYSALAQPFTTGSDNNVGLALPNLEKALADATVSLQLNPNFDRARAAQALSLHPLGRICIGGVPADRSQRVRACTAIISTGGDTGIAAVALAERGLLLIEEGKREQGLADLRQVVQRKELLRNANRADLLSRVESALAK